MTKPLQVDLNAKPAGMTTEQYIKSVAGGESVNKAAKYGLRHVDGQMNGTEAAYASELTLRKVLGEIVEWRFEAVTFTLVRGVSNEVRSLRFKPDFLVLYPDGTIEFVDVKGAKAAIQDKATIKIKMAADKFRMFTWSQAIRIKDGWERRVF